MLDGIRNFLELIDQNWTVIVVIFALIISIAKKAQKFFSKSDEEKIEIAKKQISNYILKLISDAEADYSDMISAGSIKRSQVIGKIFEEFPVLSKVTDQESLIQWIDDTIDEALITLRKIISENKENTSIQDSGESNE